MLLVGSKPMLATILASRHDLSAPELRSDCAPLASLVATLFDAGIDVHSMHDPTRGGVATTCYEAAVRSGVRMVLDEELLPVRGDVRAVCDLLGLEPLYLACEGRALVWVAPEDEARALAALRSHPLGRGATRIGTVLERTDGRSPLLLRTNLGIDRPLDMLSGLDLPRIC